MTSRHLLFTMALADLLVVGHAYAQGAGDPQGMSAGQLDHTITLTPWSETWSFR